MKPLLCAALFLAGCSANRESPPSSICDTEPETISRWDGTLVRWSGVVVDASPHGMFFAGECGRAKGITIISLPSNPSAAAFEESLFRHRFKDGAMKVEINAEIAEGGLRISSIENFQFVAMTARENRRFWSDTMGMAGIGQ